jgi:hypothetical protein
MVTTIYAYRDDATRCYYVVAESELRALGELLREAQITSAASTDASIYRIDVGGERGILVTTPTPHDENDAGLSLDYYSYDDGPAIAEAYLPPGDDADLDTTSDGCGILDDDAALAEGLREDGWPIEGSRIYVTLADAYSLWCADTRAAAMPAWWMPDYRTTYRMTTYRCCGQTPSREHASCAYAIEQGAHDKIITESLTANEAQDYGAAEQGCLRITADLPTGEEIEA